MMNNAKRPNLNEVVTVQTGPYMQNIGTVSNSQIPTLNGETKRAPSSLALAGSMNISTKGGAPALYQQADDERLKKVMTNMEKEKSLQFRQNTNNRGYGFQQTLA